MPTQLLKMWPVECTSQRHPIQVLLIHRRQHCRHSVTERHCRFRVTRTAKSSNQAVKLYLAPVNQPNRPQPAQGRFGRLTIVQGAQEGVWYRQRRQLGQPVKQGQCRSIVLRGKLRVTQR